jgi:hypothetical protein
MPDTENLIPLTPTASANGTGKTYTCQHCGQGGFARYDIPVHTRHCPQAVAARRRQTDAGRKRDARAEAAKGKPKPKSPAKPKGKPGPKPKPKAKPKTAPAAPFEPAAVQPELSFCPGCGTNLRELLVAWEATRARAGRV